MKIERGAGRRRARRVLLATALVMGLQSASAVADAIEDVPLLGPAEPHNGGWLVQLEDGSSLYTHGPDRWDNRNLFTLYGGGDKTSVSCTPPSQKRFEVVYARPKDGADRYDELAPNLRQAVYDASGLVDTEARRIAATAQARFRVACDDDGEVVVHHVVTRTKSERDSLSTVAYDLRRAGLADPLRKYIVLFDGCVAFQTSECFMRGGIAFGFDFDDRLSTDNANNLGGSDYAFVFNNGSESWPTTPNWWTVLHETAHIMGAVQSSAPHSTGLAHCTDGQDLMCYDDGGPRGHEYRPDVCPVFVRFECLGDVDESGSAVASAATGDYFNPRPVPDSYLASHWNLAATENEWLDHAE